MGMSYVTLTVSSCGSGAVDLVGQPSVLGDRGGVAGDVEIFEAGLADEECRQLRDIV